MQKNLVIVESPAKAKTIEKFLGKDFKVMSSFGHIRDLKKKNFGVNLKTFSPEYEIPADKQKIVSDLRQEAKKCDTIWLASDEDREGEAISWHLAEVLQLDPKTSNRIVFHEITKPAILKAIAEPRRIDLNLVDAQQARRVLDRLVGFKLSPVLWRKVRPQLSAGRVQSVAVRLVVEREREIQAFESEASYHVEAIFNVETSEGIVPLKASLKKTLATKAEAQEFLEACKDAKFVISEVSTKPAKRTPAPPFTTSTLQQEAARKLGFPVATTMRVAQSLYEAGLITYMRTDSMNLSDLCLNSCGPVIEKLMGKEYHKRRRYHTKAKGAQEAHEAIRPTDINREEAGSNSQERRLYNLIWKRTIACQMADAVLERTSVEIDIEGGNPAKATSGHSFMAIGEVIKFDGFLRVYKESNDNDAEHEEGNGLLPPLSAGMALERKSLTALERYTQRPFRYNEASLVHKLEELGIGRPSTYAPTISTIQQRGYVVRRDKTGEKRRYNVLTLKGSKISDTMKTETVGTEKSKLIPTDIGIVVNDFLLEHFSDIMDYNFTANVEKDFDDVAEGHTNWTELIRNFYKNFNPEVEKALEEKTEHKVGERQLGVDPESGRVMSVKIGRYGPMAQLGTSDDNEKPRFATLKPGQSIESITLEEAIDLFKLPRTLGLFEEQPVVVNTGKYGPYVNHGKLFASIPKDEDPLSLTIERAIELIMERRKADAEKFIKCFDEDKDLQVLNGRFGPYLSYKKKNVKLPKSMAARAAELTYEECKAVIDGEEKKPARSRRK
ncbi:MAG: type I DNA topoisomerase [Alloprevotella sp.]|nr:type I DNA topoisomerase [Alloprevotella sp.]